MSRIAFLILAAVVPLLALWFATPPDRAKVGLVVSPFGWPSLLVVHVLSAVPAAWLLARVIVRRRPTFQSGPAVVLGVVLALVGYLGAEGLGETLDSVDAGFVVRSLARSLFGVLLALPWCVAACLPATAIRLDPLVALACGVVGVGLPAIQADRVARQALAEVAEHAGRDRLARVLPLLAVAADVSPDRDPRIGAMTTVRQAQDVAAKSLKKLTAEADLPPSKPSVRHGELLVKLDRLTEAEEYLTPLAASNPVARLRLGECLQLQNRWQESEDALRSAVAQMLPDAGNLLIARACGECYDLLAGSATRRRSAADREAVLREALAKLPGQAGYWHLQLGRHFRMSGRPFDALPEFDLAEEADPKLKSQLDALRHEIRENTPGCLVR